MKKKLLFLIPIVFLIAFLIMILNNKKIEINDFKTKKLTSYSDVLEGENNVENTVNVKFDAYFLVDKNNDGIADKIRGNSLKIGNTSKLNIDLNVTGDAVLKNARIEFVNSNVDIGYKSSYGVSSIPLENIEGGTNKNISVTLRDSLSNDIKSYNMTNKLVLIGTIEENGQEKEIRKEVSYIVDWYRTDLSSYIDYNYTTNVSTKEEKIIVEYDFKTLSYTTSLLKSVNLNIDVPIVNGIKPTSVNVKSTNITYNYNDETNILTIRRVATLNDTMITNNVYDYKTDGEAVNNFKVTLEYPAEAGLKDASIPLNVSAYYEIYNNPDPDYQNVITSNTYNRVLVATSKSEDLIVSINEGGPVPYLIGIDSSITSSGALRKNIYDNLITFSTTYYYYSVNTKLYYTLGKINKVMIYDEKFDSFNNNYSMQNVIKYKSIRFSNSLNVLGENGYIKLIDAETNKLITILTKDNWNVEYNFEDDVRKIYIETSEVTGILPKYCKNNRECEAKYTNFLSFNVVKEIDNKAIYNNFTEQQYNSFSYIYTEMKTSVEGENASVHNIDYDYASNSKRYELPRSSNINISLDKSDLQSNETYDIKINLSTGSTDSVHYGWMNGEFIVEVPKEIIDIDINNISISNSSVEIIGYELVKENDTNLIKILTSNKHLYDESYRITIDATITPDPRVFDRNVYFKVYGLNNSYDLADNKALDKYDLNNNGRTNDYVNYGEKSLYFNDSNDVRTITLVKIYDKNNDERVIVTPNITEVYPLDDNETAKIEISLVNNSDDKVQDIKFIGKVGYPGNTYQLNNTLLNSQFNIRMTDEIVVPEELRDKVTIYYSRSAVPTDDITNPSNDWNLKENVPYFEHILSYMIVVNDYQLSKGESISFTYDAKMQMGTNLLNLTSYLTHAVYYNSLTSNGIVSAEPIEQKKTGIRMVRKYDLSLTDYKIFSDRSIDNSIYILTDEENNQKILKTDINGNIIAKGLYVGKTYKIKQQSVKYPYLLDEEEKIFKVINNSSDDLELSGNEIGTYKNIQIDDNSLNTNNSSNAVTEYYFNYTGAEQVFVVPKSGIYKLEVWGAQGGSNSSKSGGNGGYSAGYINLNQGTILYVYVGGQGLVGTNAAFNGGGKAGSRNASGGGGATDIRVETDSLYSRVIVAGGGGGFGQDSCAVATGAYGGGTTGGGSSSQSSCGTQAGGGTQTSGGTGGIHSSTVGAAGSFGIGATALDGSYDGGGGGGGWYGGGAGASGGWSNAGGGGSGFVYTSSSTVPSGYNVDAIYQLTNTSLIAGNQDMPTYDGLSTMTGNQGNGYAVITYFKDPNEVTAELKIAYGTIDNNILKYTIGSQLGELPTPTLSNQNISFEGWYLEQRHETKVNSNYVINEDIKLYAKYVDTKGKEVRTILNMNLDNETRYDLVLTNKDLDTDELIPGSKFKITGKGVGEGEILRTNSNGELNLNGLYLNEEYTIKQVGSLNHLIIAEPSVFLLTRNNNGNVIISRKINLPSETDENVLQVVQDSNSQDSPIYMINVKSKSAPTYTLELTKVSADTKEPLANAQYRLTGYGLPLNGEYIKTDENGKATIELKKTTLANELDGYTNTINGFDYSIVDGTYEIQEVVPPIGYQLDNKEIAFNYKIVYNSNNCDSNYSLRIYNCVVDENTEHVNYLIFPTIENKFADYEVDEENNVIKVTMYDYPLINIIKKDSETNELLPNTLFAVYSVSTGNMGKEILEPAKDSKGNVLGLQLKIGDKYYNVLSTDENGKLVLALSSGKYKALEVQAVDEKYQIDETGYYFSVGPTEEYDDSKIHYYGSMYEKNAYYAFSSDDTYGPSPDGDYGDIIPTSDGGWLVVTDANTDSKYTEPIMIKKYNKDLILEWEADAKAYLKTSEKQYRYFDDVNKVAYETTNGDIYKDTSRGRTHVQETKDGYYVNPHGLGVVKFDKNGNRLWQSHDTAMSNLTYYTAACYKDTAQSINPNEYLDPSFVYSYDPNNPYIQRDEETYYCYQWVVYDATYEEAGGIFRFEINPETGTIDMDLFTDLFGKRKYYDTRYVITTESVDIYDENHNVIDTKLYMVYTPELKQLSNGLRYPPLMSFGYPENIIYGEGVRNIVSTPDGGVTLLNVSARSYGTYPIYILSDGTMKSYSQYGPGGSSYGTGYGNGYKVTEDGCYVWGNDTYAERSDCDLLTNDSGGTSIDYGVQLLHYNSDGEFVSVDNLGRIYFKAVSAYNQEHGTTYSLTPYLKDRLNSFGFNIFENGDLLINVADGFLRLRFNEEKQLYDFVYFLPCDLDFNYDPPMIQIIGNDFTFKQQHKSIIYYVDSEGNMTEDVRIYNSHDSLDITPTTSSSDLTFNGYYRLENGNYLVYTQISKQWTEMGDEGIYISLNGQTVYEPFNFDPNADIWKIYFIIYEVDTNSNILWYKLYDVIDSNVKDSVYYYSYHYTPIRYNKESNEMLFTLLRGTDFNILNSKNHEEKFNSKGNLLIFNYFDKSLPEVPEAYSIEVLNNRKTFNINIESGENGKAYVLNENNTVYTLNNETKSVENIKYGDNSIYTIKAKGNDGYIIDKVLLNDEEYSYTALDDGTIILDGINDVKEEKNIKITFKPANGIVIVHHYIKDTEEKIASDEIIPATTGMLYETEPTLNELYSLVKDSNGEYILPSNYKDFFMTNPTVVTYYYEENNVNLKTNYYKENTTIELAPSKVERKLLGSSYKTSPMNIEFYELVKVIGEEEGTLNKENTEVTYMYEETYDVNLKVKYIEKETEKELSDSVNKTLKRHDNYETEAKEIENYKLVDKTSNYKGKAENQEIEVIYYYEKVKSKITTRYIEKETNKEIIEPIIKEVDINSIYTTERKGFEGYKLIENTDNINGLAEELEIEVIYYYEKIKEDPEEPKPDNPVIPKPIPNIPIKIKEKVELIINSNIDISTINNNNLEIITEEPGKEKKLKETNSNLIIIIMLGLITIIGFIIGKLKSDNNI